MVEMAADFATPSRPGSLLDALEFLTIKHMQLQEKLVSMEGVELDARTAREGLQRASAKIEQLETERAILIGEGLRFATQLAETEAAAASQHAKLLAYAAQLETENAMLRGLLISPATRPSGSDPVATAVPRAAASTAPP
jgi:hypothetical protein